MWFLDEYDRSNRYQRVSAAEKRSSLLLKKRCFMRICLTCHHHTSRTRCGFFTIGVNVRENLITWLAASLIALFLASSCFLDGPTEEQAAQDVAADVQDAIQTAQVQR